MKYHTWILSTALVVVGFSPNLAEAQTAASRPEGGPGFIADIDGAKLYYEECGRSPQTVVLIHDGVVDSSVWNDVWPQLCQHFHVVRYDRRGYGRSAAATTWYSEVDDLAVLLNVLKVDTAVLVGSSNGGELAIDFTLAYPKAVKQLVLAGPVVNGMPYSEHFLARGSHVVELLHKGAIKAAITEWSKDKYLVAPGNREARERLFNLLSTNPQDMTHADYRLHPKPALSHLHEIHVPTLILVGEADIPDVHVHAGAIEADVPNARLSIIEGVGHLMYIEKPAEFSKQVITFIELHGN